MTQQIDLRQKIQLFSEKLGRINPSSVTNEIYCHTYLSHLLAYRLYYLEIYAGVVQRVISQVLKPIKRINLIDFGAGNGLLGLFVAYCGFEKVVLHERDGAFIKSAQRIAELLDIQSCVFVCGDENVFSGYAPEFQADAIVSTDVVEHIYDLHAFINKVKLYFPDCMMLHTTAANAANPFIVRRLKKLQRMDEWKGSHPKSGDLAYAEPHPSFISIRKKIIKTVSEDINVDALNILATRTRGMIEGDIVNCVEKYLREGIIPDEPAHPTNTCNPITGSWTERLLSAEEYHQLFKSYYNNFQIESGFYNEFSTGFKSFIYREANNYVKRSGLKFAPFIFLTAY